MNYELNDSNFAFTTERKREGENKREEDVKESLWGGREREIVKERLRECKPTFEKSSNAKERKETK